MNGFDKIKMAKAEAEETAQKYLDYRVVDSKSIPYLDSIDECFIDKVNSIKSKNMIFLIVFLVVFSFVFICCLFSGNISLCILMGAILGLIIWLFISARSNKPMIAKGKVVSKKRSRYFSSPRKNFYYVSVAFDSNKTICHRIPISSSDYEQVQIGSNIVVVKYGSTIDSFLVK